jgi:hypothetical protein
LLEKKFLLSLLGFNYVLTVANEIQVTSVVLGFWTHEIPNAACITIFWAVVVAANIFGVNIFGEIEVVGSSIKFGWIVVVIISLIGKSTRISYKSSVLHLRQSSRQAVHPVMGQLVSVTGTRIRLHMASKAFYLSCQPASSPWPAQKTVDWYLPKRRTRESPCHER